MNAELSSRSRSGSGPDRGGRGGDESSSTTTRTRPDKTTAPSQSPSPCGGPRSAPLQRPSARFFDRVRLALCYRYGSIYPLSPHLTLLPLIQCHR